LRHVKDSTNASASANLKIQLINKYLVQPLDAQDSLVLLLDAQDSLVLINDVPTLIISGRCTMICDGYSTTGNMKYGKFEDEYTIIYDNGKVITQTEWVYLY
jgi:hypothetical protein